MFDINNQQIVVKVPSPDGYKVAMVRWPSDTEWAARIEKQQTVIRSLGRDRTETEVLNGEEVDAELFEKIRVPGEATFDDAEASAAIQRLARSEAGEAERDGRVFRIPLSVPGCETVHFLRMPSQKQINAYRKRIVRVIEGRRRQELKVDLWPAAELYDALADGSPRGEGAAPQAYVGDQVPIIHKAAVVAEMMQALRAEDDDPGNP